MIWLKESHVLRFVFDELKNEASTDGIPPPVRLMSQSVTLVIHQIGEYQVPVRRPQAFRTAI